MKTEALNYTLLATGLAVVMGLLGSVRIDVDIGTVLGWTTAAVLLAMAPFDYRLAWKRITGR